MRPFVYIASAFVALPLVSASSCSELCSTLIKYKLDVTEVLSKLASLSHDVLDIKSASLGWAIACSNSRAELRNVGVSNIDQCCEAYERGMEAANIMEHAITEIQTAAENLLKTDLSFCSSCHPDERIDTIMKPALSYLKAMKKDDVLLQAENVLIETTYELRKTCGPAVAWIKESAKKYDAYDTTSDAGSNCVLPFSIRMARV